MPTLSNQMGIYKIVNSVDSRIYIGSAKNMNARERVHICHLKKGKHHSIHLQRFVDKYGIASISFHMIELVTDFNQLIEREQFYLDSMNSLSPNGFNIRPVARKGWGGTMSLEAREKRRQTFLKKGGFYKHNAETKQRISECLKGRVKTPLHLERISKALTGYKKPKNQKQATVLF